VNPALSKVSISSVQTADGSAPDILSAYVRIVHTCNIDAGATVPSRPVSRAASSSR
jgi:hypothetical protein